MHLWVKVPIREPLCAQTCVFVLCVSVRLCVYVSAHAYLFVQLVFGHKRCAIPGTPSGVTSRSVSQSIDWLVGCDAAAAVVWIGLIIATVCSACLGVCITHAFVRVIIYLCDGSICKTRPTA